MSYWTKALIGLGLCGAAVVGIDWGMWHLMLTGSCASGRPYVSARPCPPGTGWHIMALIGGIFGGLIGCGVWAARGRSDQRIESPYPLPLLMWTLLFCTLSLSGLYAATGPAAGDDAPVGTAIFLTVLFVPMGLAPIPFALWGRKRSAAQAELVEHGRKCPGTVVSVEDTGIRINDNPRVKLSVRADPPGDTPFTIEKSVTVSQVSIPRPGDRCIVFYDASDPQNKNGISFDHPDVPDMPPSPPPPRPSPAPEANVMDGNEDALTKIEKLGELRAKGLITDAEFETQKRKLLDEV